MNPLSESPRNQLLGALPQPKQFEAYRAAIQAGLARQESELRREKLAMHALRLVAVVFAVLLLWFDPQIATKPQNLWLAFTMAFVATIESIRYYISRQRLDLLTEIKQLQIQILELQRRPSASDTD